jgi:hypothetical protein
MSYKQMTGNIIFATKVEPTENHEAGAASLVKSSLVQRDTIRSHQYLQPHTPPVGKQWLIPKA